MVFTFCCDAQQYQVSVQPPLTLSSLPGTATLIAHFEFLVFYTPAGELPGSGTTHSLTHTHIPLANEPD